MRPLRVELRTPRGTPRAIPQRRKSPACAPAHAFRLIPHSESRSRNAPAPPQGEAPPVRPGKRPPRRTPRASNTSHTARLNMGPPLASPGISRPAKPGKHSPRALLKLRPSLPPLIPPAEKEGRQDERRKPRPSAHRRAPAPSVSSLTRKRAVCGRSGAPGSPPAPQGTADARPACPGRHADRRPPELLRLPR